MRRFLVCVSIIGALLTSAQPAQAGGNGFAAGLVGGVAAGLMIGAARPYYAPPPVYVAPPAYVVEESGACYWIERPTWDPVRRLWVRQPVEVCD